ncbi:MAG TPA: kelch repeat-containing protein [Thermoplasmata archaeon]|nr:kelch repeat-containing protein [Thermoplasmata archaeon]
MAFDPVDGYLVLFGGCTSGDMWYSACNATNATWVLTNHTWSQLNTPLAPPARYSSTMVWDAADQELVLFGGNTTSSGFLNDTWTFSHGSWTQLHPSSAPGARADAKATYDPQIGAVVLNGGEQNRTLVYQPTQSYSGSDWDDTWLFSNGTWTPLASTASEPPARDGQMMAVDPSMNRTLLFGGFNWSGWSSDDTWVFHKSGWVQLATTITPPVRNNGMMTDVPSSNVSALFGGHFGWNFLDDTWLLKRGAWTALNLSVSPSARWAAMFASDPQTHGCAVLFGGYLASNSSTGISTTGTFYNDTWLFGTHCTGSDDHPSVIPPSAPPFWGQFLELAVSVFVRI